MRFTARFLVSHILSSNASDAFSFCTELLVAFSMRFFQVEPLGSCGVLFGESTSVLPGSPLLPYVCDRTLPSELESVPITSPCEAVEPAPAKDVIARELFVPEGAEHT